MNLGENLAPHIVESTLIERDLEIKQMTLSGLVKLKRQLKLLKQLLLNSETASPILMQN